jgi:rhodanese-related sulfurtransferase
VNLLKYNPSNVYVFDLRPQNEFKRWHLEGSTNLPFTNLILSDKRLESLSIDRETLNDKIIVVTSVSHDNAFLFAEFLIECDVSMVCILHHSINSIHAIMPSIFVSC